MYGDFILVEEGKTARAFRRRYLNDPDGRDEAWLRNIALTHPQTLPIADIDPTFGPLIPLCSELRTPAGPVDAAFINAQGRLTLAEFKLWKNPQSRREVVGQVLDYVASISAWSYADLQRQVAAATGRSGNVPYALASERSADGLREAEFVDAVTRSLRQGRILALVIGDGIREEVQRLAETINRSATRAFSLGIVEVALYEMAERQQVLVQPRVLAKTEVLTRQVVVAHGTDADGTLNLADAEPKELAAGSDPLPPSALGRQHLREWWAPVLGTSFDDPEQEPPYWSGTNNVVLRTPYQGILIKAFALVDSPAIEVFVAGSRRDNVRAIEDHIRAEQQALARELPAGTVIAPEDDWPIRTRETSLQGDVERRAWIGRTLNAYVNALRPRLRAWYAVSPR
jgi:hypothetical protein